MFHKTFSLNVILIMIVVLNAVVLTLALYIIFFRLGAPTQFGSGENMPASLSEDDTLLPSISTLIGISETVSAAIGAPAVTGSGGTVYMPKCLTSTSCTPPSCASGWTDLGTGRTMATMAANNGGYYAYYYNERYCWQQ